MGDVCLSRGVASEAAREGDPWRDWPVEPGTFRVGNLEGSLAAGPCRRTDGLCLAIDEPLLDRLVPAGFRAMSLANNHALDHGPEGLAATAAALRARGVVAVTAGDGPHLIPHGDRTVALVGVDLAHPDRRPELDVALREVATARSLTPWVVALVHDGVEPVATPSEAQRAAAAELRAHGATLVVGAHAHVPQPVVCERDGITAYGLGNHLFDQHFAATWTGLVLTCRPDGEGLGCETGATVRDARSTFPRPGAAPGERCRVAPGPVDTRWRAHPDAPGLVGAAPLTAAGPDAFFALRWQHSTFDDSAAWRPYVFDVGADGVVDRWRGTALGWPLVAARVVDGPGGTVCALHRDDGPLRPDPTTRGRRWQAWRWNGFGFDAVDAPCEPTAPG